MNNFAFYSPTLFAFGDGEEKNAGALVRRFGGSRWDGHDHGDADGGADDGHDGATDRPSASASCLCLCCLRLYQPHSGEVLPSVRQAHGTASGRTACR